MDSKNKIAIKICYSNKLNITLLDISVSTKTTLLEAIEQCNIYDLHKEINLDTFKFGVFGNLKFKDYILQSGDRVEIYRPLVANPMDARRRRAKKHTQQLLASS